MLTPREISVGGRYIGATGSPWREVRTIQDGQVEYLQQGTLSLIPLRMPIDQFAGWAEALVPEGDGVSG